MGKHWTSREKKLLLCVVVLSVAVISLLFASRSSEQAESIHGGMSSERAEFPFSGEHPDESEADAEGGGERSEEDAGREGTEGQGDIEQESGDDANSDREQQTAEPAEQLVVDVKGAVHHPDVYVMRGGDRIKDVLEKAGGVNGEATTDPLNLAQMVEDGMVIYVPTVEEVEEAEQSGKSGEQNETGSTAVDGQAADAETQWVRGGTAGTTDARSGSDVTEANGGQSAEDGEGNASVNINEADETELQTLAGIGPSKADAIIRHREEHGLFNDVRDIMNVTGIGPAIFEQIEQDIEI